MYPTAPKRMITRETKVAFEGHGRFMKSESATATKRGVDDRKMMNVSTCKRDSCHELHAKVTAVMSCRFKRGA